MKDVQVLSDFHPSVGCGQWLLYFGSFEHLSFGFVSDFDIRLTSPAP